ncbi:DUF6635 family protein [Amphritea japonica]|uniref:Uncharacterized protein n=1 Tax=Amphritea japonica ATCC BAA-1530 TaxID=1278309 RepID=A0A7R6STM1_9GAMM|nr:DUF6635 family protein [Amphritea japonica]BBB27445.1 conserved hypothetical protein [Amphritea japonica ATCC BAA-1530]
MQSSESDKLASQGVLEEAIQQSVIRGIHRYFDACRQRVPGFIQQHFSYPAALTTNRVAFGLDVLRAPVNLFWAPLFALVSMIRFGVGRFERLSWLHRLLGRFPAGFTTQVQTHISELVLRDLLQHNLPQHSLSWFIAEELRTLYQQNENTTIGSTLFHARAEPIVEEALAQYRITRTASADITNTLSCTVLGAFAFQKFTPGGIGIALVLSTIISTELAATDFFLGETLGHLYYSVFPPSPSIGVTLATIAGVLSLLSAGAALSGVISDPIQAAIGLHRYRLNKMLRHMELDMLRQTDSSFRPKDQYVARIMECFDLVRAGLS